MGGVQGSRRQHLRAWAGWRVAYPSIVVGIERADVEHVAKLARLHLSEEEIELFKAQLSRILDHAARVTALDTEGVEPTSHAIPLKNVFRPDETVIPMTQEEALSNAPLAEDGFFRVPRIAEED